MGRQLRPWPILFMIFLYSSQTWGNSISTTLGYFDITASVGNKSGTVADLGAVRLNYWHDLSNKFSLAVGYTILLENYGSGDSSFGLDMGGIYRPFNQQYSDFKSSSGLSINLRQKWNPFVGVSFHQRQFQSINSSYSGIGFSGGTEYDINQNFLLIGDIRVITLAGPLEGEALEFSINFGVSFKI